MSVSRQTLTASLCIAAFAGLTIGGLGGCIVGYQIGKGHAAGAVFSKSKVYTRDEFRKLVMGKTPDEILGLLGKPDTTSEDIGSGPEWTYYDRRRDPLTGKLDEITTIRFYNGRVVEVR